MSIILNALQSIRTNDNVAKMQFRIINCNRNEAHTGFNSINF